MAYAKRVKTGKELRLKDVPTDDTGGLTKGEVLAKTTELGEEMAKLLELLFAARQHGLLILLQGRDTSGKDGAIRRILNFANVQSTRVVPFKVPTEQERSHDFLWRVHPYAPGKGDVTIFNRSHYEDVLVARVHDLVPKRVWKSRYDHINAFESLLVDSGTIVLKFYLHLSADEQKERLLAREAEPEKSWKLSIGDWKERELWDDYTEAYEDALNRCSPETAPWRIVPADHKWFRDLAIIDAIVTALKPYEDDWRESLRELGEQEKASLVEYRKSAKS